ncbi:NADP-dependent phosphogluconate dehydrogenase [Pararcticibacter amylolyticus]|uniref:6-phosphogluconate dehydrogenase, decarboxylating n=1 Tax=Pararcticibacter amylolyticus TaxID=2173175 RepID=A0A2U2PKU3_9SPHI|nr:NADP-dependent phosphogluconate dehydrogenase [Pararcticibacter amylolyticus]PWG82025.1 phosphogluconate dehydrogenase (NADP(+)-dependent, decarboxylating) [Pararcticibacter amylolyticus]
MKQYDFGVVGLGVMGRNLLLNIADHHFAAAGLDLDAEKVKALETEKKDEAVVKGTTSAAEFVEVLKTPRAIMFLVPAGKAVDSAINSLLPFLNEGDILIDGGNSYFTDTDRRVTELAAKGIHFFGMGISGGEKGARLGPSMMPGGDKQAYERLRPVFEAVAAKVNGDPCVAYLGSGSAGNYVKMVHNGIEYAIMQLISEVYDLMKRGFRWSETDIQKTFEEWNNSELSSFLLEITAEILKKKDPDTGTLLVDLISDQARQKGTGKWTSQNAMDLQVPVPVIDSAVMMRDLSAYKNERIEASAMLNGPQEGGADVPAGIQTQLKNAYYFSVITIYAQGFAQLKTASSAYSYGLDLKTVAAIWRGGCIIRSASLETFMRAFSDQPVLPNLMLDRELSGLLNQIHPDSRAVVKLAVDLGVPAPAFMASLAYYDGYRSKDLPTNLIQAQRDYFGAHQYQRTDREGIFHTIWD